MAAHDGAQYSYVRLDGWTPPAQRQEMVDDFNGSPTLFAFLISTTAGRLGIEVSSSLWCLPPQLVGGLSVWGSGVL